MINSTTNGIRQRSAPLVSSAISRLQWDVRLGGIPRLAVVRDGELMQIPDEIRKCVAFVGSMRNSGFEFGGTVFFVAYPLEGTDQFAVYAITARHVIEQIDKVGIDGKSYFRVNHREQGAQLASMALSEWTVLDDTAIDVAAAPVKIDFEIIGPSFNPPIAFRNGSADRGRPNWAGR